MIVSPSPISFRDESSGHQIDLLPCGSDTYHVSFGVLSKGRLVSLIWAGRIKTISKISALGAELEEKMREATRTIFGLNVCFPGRAGSAPQTDLVFPNLLATIKSLFPRCETDDEKVALISYPLHYQHYNAEFTERENWAFNYPSPVCRPQHCAGYVRSEYHRLLDIVDPYLKRINRPIKWYINSKGPDSEHSGAFRDIVRLTSSSALPMLEMFYGEIYQLDALPPNGEGIKVVIRANTFEGIQKEIEKIEKKTRDKHRKLKFVFLLETEGIDCTLAWGGEWFSPTKNNKVNHFGLNKVFDESVYTKLNEAGAVPDRLAIHDFLVCQIRRERLEQELNSLSDQDLSPLEGDSLTVVERFKCIESFRFGDDNAHCSIFRDAACKWYTHCFANMDSTLVDHLLRSQVFPWMREEADIFKWAKGYQNLCEIAMFCIHAYPDSFKEYTFRSAMLELLPKDVIQAETVVKKVGLFPYGMSSIFYVFHHLFKRPELRDKGDISIACLVQNYFETAQVVSHMKGYQHIDVKNFHSLDEVKTIPDLLIAEIHPQNAAKKEIFQHDVAKWVPTALSKDPEKKMVLILDLTLNFLSDPIVKETFHSLLPYIRSGALELFCVQSFAKLMQLGADNFSGGACLYLGNREAVELPNPIARKGIFFSLMLKHFQEEIAQYFDQIRKNTDWVYLQLMRELSVISERVYIRESLLSKEINTSEESENEVPFCATELITNVDEKTVYIAISFKNLFKVFSCTKKESERWVKKLREFSNSR